METVFNTMLELLKNRDIRYELLSHKAVFTSEEAARTRSTPITESAKSLTKKLMR